MIPVFFDAQMSVPTNNSFSPSAGKPEAAVADWVTNGFPLHIMSPLPVERKELYAAHKQSYVDEVLDLERANGFGNTSPEVAASLPFTVGSIASAARFVMRHDGVACSPTSGFHHAGHNYGGGFCTFNGLIVAALEARKQGAQSVVIIDEDMHYGDGTDDIIRTLNLDWLRHHTLGAHAGYADGDVCLAELDNALWRHVRPTTDLVIYQAGADCHVDDPLGGVYTTEEMGIRDRMVFKACRKYGVPCVFTLAGGYQRDESGSIEPVLALHRQTMRICMEVYGA